MLNNVLATLKYDITGAALSAVFTPLAGTTFNLPPGGTDATGVTTGGTKTYGAPIETFILADRLDLTQAKYEIVKASVRVAEVAGAYTSTLTQRGAEGTAATAWTAGAYVFQVTTAELLALRIATAMMRSGQVAMHDRASLLKWDGANFSFGTFRFGNVGRGDHWSTDGRYTVAMPANGKTVKGFGGAADIAVAGGVIALPENQTLYYELNINAANTDADTGDRFRVVAATADYIVPNHWLMIASHSAVTAGDKGLRVCTGVTLYPWIVIGAFLNAWVAYGAGENAPSYMKDAAGWVSVQGVIKSGATGTNAFNLPAGYRPANTIRVPITTSGGIGIAEISSGGNVAIQLTTGTNALVNVDTIRFIAVA